MRRDTRGAVKAAVIDLLGEGGYARLTYEGITARSGVAKTTLYRHWPTKAELVADLVLHDRPFAPLTADAGPLAAADSLAERVVAFLHDDGAATIVPGLIAGIAADANAGDRFRDMALAMGADELRGVWTVLQARGSGPGVTDLQMILLGSAHLWLTVARLDPAETTRRVRDLLGTLYDLEG